MNELNQMFMVVNNLNVKVQGRGSMVLYLWRVARPNCIAGFGDTPEDALRDFYKQWKVSKIIAYNIVSIDEGG